jgi:hypothetical protein
MTRLGQTDRVPLEGRERTPGAKAPVLFCRPEGQLAYLEARTAATQPVRSGNDRKKGKRNGEAEAGASVLRLRSG